MRLTMTKQPGFFRSGRGKWLWAYRIFFRAPDHHEPAPSDHLMTGKKVVRAAGSVPYPTNVLSPSFQTLSIRGDDVDANLHDGEGRWRPAIPFTGSIPDASIIAHL